MDKEQITALAPRFHALFAGFENSCGFYNGLLEKNADGKVLGTDRRTVHTGVTVEMWEDHLAGRSALGVVPIRLDSTVVFGAVDVDVYDVDQLLLARMLRTASIPLLICRSKSGGAHVYCFASEPIPAALMIARLQEIAAFLGHGGVEIFPKQSEMLENEKSSGSWINMPYANGMLGMRFGIRASDGMAMEIEEFLQAADAAKQDMGWFKKPLTVSPDMPQGPPCLQHLIQIGFPAGTRNNGLYNLAVYARKADPDNWEQMVEAMNAKYMTPPLDAAEVLGVIKSVNRKSYVYKCSDHPIAAHCNSSLCRTRKFGIGVGALAMPELGRLSKLNTVPPLWFLEVNGRRMECSTEQLQKADLFQKRCMEQLTICPPIPKREVWQVLIDKLMKDVDILPAPVEHSPEGQFWDLLEQFCSNRYQALAREEIMLGKPWTENGKTYFRFGDLKKFLDRNRFSKLQDNQLYQVLKDRGGVSTQLHLKNNRTPNVWVITAFAEQTETYDVPASIEEEKPF